MTNYWIYSELIGGSDKSVYAVLQGQWPSYDAASPVAAITAEPTPQASVAVADNHGA
jgi:hypothetical protein